MPSIKSVSFQAFNRCVEDGLDVATQLSNCVAVIYYPILPKNTSCAIT